MKRANKVRDLPWCPSTPNTLGAIYVTPKVHSAAARCDLGSLLWCLQLKVAFQSLHFWEGLWEGYGAGYQHCCPSSYVLRAWKVPGAASLPPFPETHPDAVPSILSPLNLSPTAGPRAPRFRSTARLGRLVPGCWEELPAHLGTFLRNRNVTSFGQDAAYWEGQLDTEWSDIWSLVGLLC